MQTLRVIIFLSFTAALIGCRAPGSGFLSTKKSRAATMTNQETHPDLQVSPPAPTPSMKTH